jgi:hypothetical protein
MFARSQVISGSIVSYYGLDDRGSIPDRGKGFLLYPLCPDRLWGPPSLLYNGYRGSFPRGKARPGRDADHSSHPVQRSRMSSSYNPLPPSAFMTCGGTALAQRTSVTISSLCMFEEIIFVYSENHMRLTDTVCGQNKIVEY